MNMEEEVSFRTAVFLSTYLLTRARIKIIDYCRKPLAAVRIKETAK